MKKIIYFPFVIFLVLITSSCYDRDIIDAKDGVSLPPVTNLKSTLANTDQVTLDWSIPSTVPAEIQRPMYVYVQVYRGDVREYQASLPDEPVTWTYTLLQPDKKYRVIVKMYGRLKEKEYGKSDEIYSLGQTVSVN